MNTNNNTNNHESFRDSLSTVTNEGERVWVYPKKPSGRYYRARTILSYFLLAFLFLAPLIKIDGRPLMLLNILERKFIIFGIPFGPQDFHLFVLAMVIAIVGIFLFTVVYGRVFCGWICPQTVFLEMVFRKIDGLHRAKVDTDATSFTPQRVDLEILADRLITAKIDAFAALGATVLGDLSRSSGIEIMFFNYLR